MAVRLVIDTPPSQAYCRLGRCTCCEVPLQVVEGVRGLNI